MFGISKIHACRDKTFADLWTMTKKLLSPDHLCAAYGGTALAQCTPMPAASHGCFLPAQPNASVRSVQRTRGGGGLEDVPSRERLAHGPAPDIQQQLQQALALHKAGQLAQARTIYQYILNR